METTHSTEITRFKVGIFTVLGLSLIALTTVLINGNPFWWRPCQLVNISVEDASGLKTKSPIRSLGIEIGYLKSVMLSETHVTLGICITAPVEVLPSTRAYIRGEGFLGDKFVELKPVKYIGEPMKTPDSQAPALAPATTMPQNSTAPGANKRWPAAIEYIPEATQSLLDWLIPSAYAANPSAGGNAKSREIPVGEGGQDMQEVVKRVD